MSNKIFFKGCILLTVTGTSMEGIEWSFLCSSLISITEKYFVPLLRMLDVNIRKEPVPEPRSDHLIFLMIHNYKWTRL